MYHLLFASLRRSSFSLLMAGLASLAMGGCPQVGPGGGAGGNDPPSGQDLIVVTKVGQGNVDQTADGDMVTLTAVLVDGWIFDGWSGADLNDEQRKLNPLTVDATQVESITATFIEDPEQPRPVDACGDGVVQRTEECDDGGETALCNADCTTSRCGDGILNTAANEQCDGGTGCSSTCQNETPTQVRCGDGIKNGTDECDDGHETAACNADCTTSRCGDGVKNVHAGEQCDDENAIDEDDCSSSCLNKIVLPSGCGDGVKSPTEQCDTSGESATCNVNCTTSRCGDGIVNSLAGEQCDDTNTVNGDGCSPTCQIETTTPPPPPPPPPPLPTGSCCVGGNCSTTTQANCSGTWTQGGSCASNPCSQPTDCGNGVVNPPEECDEGGESASCNANCTTSICGDGIKNVHAGEQCDDRNTVAGDGCANCRTETVPTVANDRCAAATTIGDETRIFSNRGATTDGLEDPVCNVGNEDRGQVGSDIWYCYTASCTGTALAGLCGSGYDTKLAVYSGCGCPTAAPLACRDDNCWPEETRSRVNFVVTTGQKYLIRVGGYNEAQGDGALTIGCNLVDACADGSGDCLTPRPTGVPLCDDETCCKKTCDLDPYCCEVTWDQNCADEAEGVCDGSFQACPGTGACGVLHTTPGCDNASCCNKVCFVDSYCCSTEWDDQCVEKAGRMCP